MKTCKDGWFIQQTSECLLQPETSHVFLALFQTTTGQMGRLRVLEGKTPAPSPLVHQASTSGGLSIRSCLPAMGLSLQSRRAGFSHDPPSPVAHSLFLLPCSPPCSIVAIGDLRRQIS